MNQKDLLERIERIERRLGIGRPERGISEKKYKKIMRGIEVRKKILYKQLKQQP